MAFGELVVVKHDLFSAGHAAFTAALCGILFTFLGPRVVIVFAAPGGDRQIRLLDAREHLGVEGVREWLDVFRHRIGVGVLGLEVVDRVGIGLLAKPVIVIDAGGAVTDFTVFHALCGW